VTGYRADVTELGEARRRVETLVSRLPGGDGERAFDQPWELRAFAMAVAAYENGYYEWSEFQLSLIESIRQWETDHGPETDHRPEPDSVWSYYDHWLTALETVLAHSGAFSSGLLDERTRQVLATPRDANHHHAHREPVAVDPVRS
jgi:nitrile hydratase accessory protein